MRLVLVMLVLATGCAQVLGIEERGGGDDDDGDSGIGAGGPATSCADISSSCAGFSCCDSPVVTGGDFFRSYDVAADAMFPDMVAPATISTFRLDRFEVTVERFRAFVASGKGTLADPPATGSGVNGFNAVTGWDSNDTAELAADSAALAAALSCGSGSTYTAEPGENDHLPITCITWYEAHVFCGWDGGFLPIEAQWNYAATGGAEQRAYPWSDPPGDTTIDLDRVVYVEAEIFDVGSRPPGRGRYRQFDLAGNASEWVVDRNVNYVTPCDDCASVGDANQHTLRGGSWFQTEGLLRTAYRGSLNRAARSAGVGVRCARLP